MSKESAAKTKTSWVWIRATDGKPSMSATFATVAFVATTALYIAAAFEQIGPLTMRPFDPTVCAAYLMPVLMLYFGRRATDAKASSERQGEES